jgi:hypothetical protein
LLLLFLLPILISRHKSLVVVVVVSSVQRVGEGQDASEREERVGI